MKLHALSALALGAAIAVGCGDSTGVQPDDLAGTWNATSVTFTSVANSSTSVEVIGLGATLTIVIQSNGSVSLAFNVPGETPSTDTGTLSVSGSDFTLVIDGDTSTGTITRNGDVVTLSIQTGVEFDFDDDGTDEAATAVIVLQKA